MVRYSYVTRKSTDQFLNKIDEEGPKGSPLLKKQGSKNDGKGLFFTEL